MKQLIALGPAASQIAIKQLGTNGGGIFGANSAFPFENPTMLSNFLFVTCLVIVTFSEISLARVWGNISGSSAMEGKEIIHGVGCGAYGMLAFVILTVFIAGLMVGRTPEYLGKKMEPFDIKMVCLIVLIPPLCTLFGTATAVLMPQASSWMTNTEVHGFSEILYAFSSMAGNNGSAFGGFAANTVFTNIFGGIIMLFARFVPMTTVVLLAGNLADKKLIAASERTLSTKN